VRHQAAIEDNCPLIPGLVFPPSHHNTAAMEPNIQDSFISLEHHFLIAMPGMMDPGFADALVYICRHTPEGAMGLRVNRCLDITLRELFLQLQLPCEGRLADQLLFAGGPVRGEWGFVLHEPTESCWQSSLEIAPGVCLTASRDILAALATGEGAPERSLVALGYSGWAAGQLEEELASNAWLTTTADLELLFDAPLEARTRLAAARIGVDLTRLSTGAGHA